MSENLFWGYAGFSYYLFKKRSKKLWQFLKLKLIFQMFHTLNELVDSKNSAVGRQPKYDISLILTNKEIKSQFKDIACY